MHSCLLYFGSLLVSLNLLVSGNEYLIRDLTSGNLRGMQTDKRATIARVQNFDRMFSNLVSIIGIKPVLGEDVLRGDLSKADINDQYDSLINGNSKKKRVNRDYVFVLDTSASIPGSEFKRAKETVATLVESFCPLNFGHQVTDKGNKQVAMILFGSTVTKVLEFEDSWGGLTSVQDKILEVNHRMEGSTSTATALNYVREAILGKKMSRVKNTDVTTDVIVITDGMCNSNCDDLGKEADAIRAMGANVIAFGVENANESELDIMSGKNRKASFELDGMKDLSAFANYVISKARSVPDRCI